MRPTPIQPFRNALTGFLMIGLLWSSPGFSQQEPSQEDQKTQKPKAEEEDKRIFGIIPNFRTSPTLAEYQPIRIKEKFHIAAQDSFDRGTIALAAIFGAEAQFSNSNPTFGQGVRGYVHYFGTAYADFIIGNYMTEGVFPTVLHQDPRYFRRGTGNGIARLGYAAGQIFWTHNDSGRGQFNYSEIGGNATAVAISMSYYPENRDPGDAVSKFGSQIGVDMVANVLKEFWPDLSRKFSHKNKAED